MVFWVKEKKRALEEIEQKPLQQQQKCAVKKKANKNDWKMYATILYYSHTVLDSY